MIVAGSTIVILIIMAINTNICSAMSATIVLTLYYECRSGHDYDNISIRILKHYHPKHFLLLLLNVDIIIVILQFRMSSCEWHEWWGCC